MNSTFKYRLYPKRSQATALNKQLDACRWVYNHFLEMRKKSWEDEQQGLGRYDQTGTLPELKKEHEFLNDAYSQCLQNVAVRVDLSFRAFFRRVKAGDKPGYPRFRGKFRYDSFTYPQYGGFKVRKNGIHLGKIGTVKARLHRPIEGDPKTCTVRRTPTGKWFVTIVCNVEHTPAEQPDESAIGIDMGLENFATLSSSETIANPRFFRKEQAALTKAQRKLSAQKKRTKAREKARRVVARVHERIANKRHDFIHQQSRKLVNRFNTVVVEDLSVNDMKKDNFRCINKSIGDAAWRMFLSAIDYKAECAGGRMVTVNPAYTSQTCSGCGTRQKLKLSDRQYHCQCCGLSLSRDHNAALNILALGVQGLAAA